MAITAAMVKELREMTGAGMMDCKKALNETNGNMDEAVDWLRKKGLASAAKKASRFSETHWKLIYLLQNPEWSGKAVCIDHKDDGDLFMIPSLAMQTIIKGLAGIELNDEIDVKAQNIDIPTQKVEFIRL